MNIFRRYIARRDAAARQGNVDVLPHNFGAFAAYREIVRREEAALVPTRAERAVAEVLCCVIKYSGFDVLFMREETLPTMRRNFGLGD